MDWSEIFASLVTSITISVFLFLAANGSAKSQERTNAGTFKLRANKFYYYFGMAFFLLIPIGILLGLYYNLEGGILPILGIVLMIGIPSLGLILFYRNCILEFDEQSITVTNIYNKPTTIQWAEIEDISFGKISGYVKIRTDTELLKVHFHTVGLIEFIRMMERETDWRNLDLKIPI